MEHIVNINNDNNDKFEAKADNVITVEIIDSKGEKIVDDVKIGIFMSKNAMIGLGTELIRLAYSFKNGKHVHLEPAELDNLCQRLGVFLTPDSKEVIITCSDHNTIDDYL